MDGGYLLPSVVHASPTPPPFPHRLSEAYVSARPQHILLHMKQILIELDDRCARDLERVAPAKNRRRAEFVRLAIRSAIDRALDRATEAAYRAAPPSRALTEGDLCGWDEHNELARRGPAVSARGGRRKSAA